MVRNLYRFYLYSVYILLLYFIGAATGMFLQVVLRLTPLRGSYESPPNIQEISQSGVLFVVALLIAGAVGGLHYWLIRRDIQHDPAGGTSAIRSFFLNYNEAFIISITIPVFAFSLANYAQYAGGGGMVWSLAWTIPALAIATLLEFERRRILATQGLALVFQRLHLYLVQFILLSSLFAFWNNYLMPLVDGSLFQNSLRKAGCSPYCDVSNPWLLLLAFAWFLFFWGLYTWLTRKDDARFLRLILHGLSFAGGVSAVLYGLHNALKYAFTLLFDNFVPTTEYYPPDAYSLMAMIVPFVTFGVLVLLVYHWCLRQAVRRNTLDAAVLPLLEIAIVAIVAGAIFWRGISELVNKTLLLSLAVQYQASASSWAEAVSFVLVGAGYIGLDLYLRRRNQIDPTTAAGPRRALVLALLGGGILALAIGGAVALYSSVTALLGFPINNWQQTCYSALAVFIVGVCLTAIYLWMALREQQFTNISKLKQDLTTPETAPVTEAETEITVTLPSQAPSTVEEIIDALLAGKISRDEAVMSLSKKDASN